MEELYHSIQLIIKMEPHFSLHFSHIMFTHSVKVNSYVLRAMLMSYD